MDSTLPARLDSIARVAIAEGAAPGASIAVGRYGRLVLLKGYGTLDYSQGSPAVEPSTIYDLASLTKVVATTTAAMILEEAGKLDLNKTVGSYVPELNAPDKAAIARHGRVPEGDQRTAAVLSAGHPDGVQRLGHGAHAGGHRAHHRHVARALYRRPRRGPAAAQGHPIPA
jgi:CubicO group peptidase (beta-lactamase class C family)